MYILTVSPVSRGALQPSLTYFSKNQIDVGMVILVPVRTREIPAIVLESREVTTEKSTLKASDYAIRKVTNAKPRRIWSPAFLKGVEDTASYSAQKLGETLLAVTPKTVLDAHLDGTLPEPPKIITENSFELLAIQDSTQKRYESYQRHVRESFVRHESVFVCVPTEEDVLRVTKVLGHGIENYTFALRSGLTKKRMLETWQNICTEKHSVLVVGTAQYLGVPRYFRAIILDEEHSPSWKMFVRPFLDMRVFVENYARRSGSKCILGATILRAETHSRIESGEINKFERIVTRIQRESHPSAYSSLIVDPRKEEKEVREYSGKRDMILITKELCGLIEGARERSEQVLILSARKGLAPVTACGDCGTLVRCPMCDTPLVIHKKESSAGVQTQVFICHGCGFTRIPENNINETCPKCGSWKLQGVGIGIDRIDEEIKKLFPDIQRFVMDGSRAKTRVQTKKIIEQFEKSKGGILIGTPMVTPYLDTMDNTAIISIDSLFAIPNIRMPERIFSLILELREKTGKALLIQTRADDKKIFEQALSGDLLDFTNGELSLRKMFSYPPFGTIIKITVRGKRAEIITEIDRLKTFLSEYSPISSGTMAKEPKNIFRMHLILKLSEKTWPEDTLLAKLRTLPHHFTIEVNPDHLL